MDKKTDERESNYMFPIQIIFVLFLSSWPLVANDAFLKSIMPHDANAPLTLKNIKTGHLTRQFLQHIKKITNTDVFVETGTYCGDTALEASFVFDEVYTVELSDALFSQYHNLFELKKNVYRYQGESPLFLKKNLPFINKKILFWLDAHYSMGVTARGSKDTPIVEELQSIKESGVTDAIIMIDDMRHFYKTDSDYPSLTKVFELVLAINPGYQIVLLGDILIAAPGSLNLTCSSVVWACTVSRLYDENPNFPVDITSIDRIIGAARDEELNEIQNLYQTLSWQEADGMAYGSYTWWYALVLLRQKKFDPAFDLLKTALIFEGKQERLQKMLFP